MEIATQIETSVLTPQSPTEQPTKTKKPTKRPTNRKTKKPTSPLASSGLSVSDSSLLVGPSLAQISPTPLPSTLRKRHVPLSLAVHSITSTSFSLVWSPPQEQLATGPFGANGQTSGSSQTQCLRYSYRVSYRLVVSFGAVEKEWTTTDFSEDSYRTIRGLPFF